MVSQSDPKNALIFAVDVFNRRYKVKDELLVSEHRTQSGPLWIHIKSSRRRSYEIW